MARPVRIHHVEKHFTAGAMLRDIVLGMSDGLTVPFALAAGLATAMQTSSIVVTAGLAEIAAGAISMGLGGYLAGRSDAEHYAREKSREEREIREIPLEEEREIVNILQVYGVTHEESKVVVNALKRKPEMWRDFMLKFELGLDEPDPKRAIFSALTIGCAYIVGGLVPLSPYMLIQRTDQALITSVAVTLLALLAFGYVKGRIADLAPLRSAWRTMLIGSAAATAAFVIARAFGAS